MADQNPDDLLRWWETLKGRRAQFDSMWQDIVEMIWPDSADFTSQRTVQGEKRTTRQYDPRATLALEKFAAVLESLLTPRGRRWHRLTSTNEELNKIQRVREFWDYSADWLFAQRSNPASRYYSQKHDGYKSSGAFGTDCMFIDQHPTGRIRYRYCALPNVWVSVNHEGVVDTVFRRMPLAAHQAIKHWGDKAPELAREDMKKDPFKERDYLHVVMPRTDVDYDRLDFMGMPWASYELAVDGKQLITEGGYGAWPYPFSRYTRKSDEDYGRGPAALVLPAVRTLNEMKRTHLEAGEQVARPAMLLPEDGIVGSHDTGEIDMRGGGLIYGGTNDRGDQLMRPLLTGGRLDISREMMMDEVDVIEDGFLVSLYKVLFDGPQRTATEVLELMREKGHLITPTIGRQQSEFLGPQITRELQIGFDSGQLGALPPELLEADGEYEIVYESPATEMQRADELIGTRRMLETAFALIERFPGEAAEIQAMIAVPEVIRLEAEVGGAPAKVLRGEEEVRARMAAEAQAAQEREALEALPALAGAARDAATAAKTAPELAA
ncbi:MAG: hypothetical protein KC616_23225 [Myxococcales bacterium]|nr:hypothetical protein [Myxococcales bacterium]